VRLKVEVLGGWEKSLDTKQTSSSGPVFSAPLFSNSPLHSGTKVWFMPPNGKSTSSVIKG
jgi:hypothetical protein